MNTMQKGKNAEKEFAKILTERGYSVYRVPKTRWNHVEDIFGLFDILACNSDGVLDKM